MPLINRQALHYSIGGSATSLLTYANVAAYENDNGG
jgi:hypothetical protein